MFSSLEFTRWPRGPHSTHKVESQGQVLAEFDTLASNNIVSMARMLSGPQPKGDTGLNTEIATYYSTGQKL